RRLAKPIPRAGQIPEIRVTRHPIRCDSLSYAEHLLEKKASAQPRRQKASDTAQDRIANRFDNEWKRLRPITRAVDEHEARYCRWCAAFFDTKIGQQRD